MKVEWVSPQSVSLRTPGANQSFLSSRNLRIFIRKVNRKLVLRITSNKNGGGDMQNRTGIVIPKNLKGKARINYYQNQYAKLNRVKLNGYYSEQRKRKAVPKIINRNHKKTSFSASDIMKIPFGRTLEFIKLFKNEYTYIPMRR